MITVIITAYNIASWLGECLDAVQAQTYRDLEILLVDDGSTDGTGAVCDRYASGDHRIRVIHQSNGGPSRARNAALDLASGEWIFFLDGDDVPDPEACEKLLACARSRGADLVIGQRMKFSGKVPPKKEEKGKDIQVLTPGEALLQLFYRKLPCYAWGKLYHRDVIGPLRFPKGWLFEDTYLVPDLVNRAQRVAVIPDTVYLYRQTPNSIIHSAFSPRKMDQLKAVEHAVSRYGRMGDAYRKALDAWKFFACADLLGRLYAEGGFGEERRILTQGIQDTKKTVLRDGECRIEERLMALAAMLSPKLLARASYMGRKKEIQSLK